MIDKNPNVDHYLAEGCGRCFLGGTPQCKVHRWPKELEMLRRIALDCGLEEQVKWGIPVYSHHNKNIVAIAAFKENCVLSFFKGALLANKKKILESAGENSRSVRLVRFTDSRSVVKLEPELKRLIFEAIEVEKAGLKVESNRVEEYKVVPEWKKKLKKSPELKKAFASLTPGRQKAYLIFFAEPKQGKTRESRIEKCIPIILKGKGLHDNYINKKSR